VYIAPDLTNGVGESQFYLDKVTFELGSNNDSNLLSKAVSIWGITNFQSEIGTDSCPFVIGADKNTVITNYPVQITKQEANGNIYAQLPLLNLQITKTSYALQSFTAINVYKTKKSIPLIIQPPLATVTNKNGVGTMQ